jgi:hypothetical protein
VINMVESVSPLVDDRRPRHYQKWEMNSYLRFIVALALDPFTTQNVFLRSFHANTITRQLTKKIQRYFLRYFLHYFLVLGIMIHRRGFGQEIIFRKQERNAIMSTANARRSQGVRKLI